MRGGEGDVVGSVDDLLALPAQSTSALVERGTLGTCLTSLSPPLVQWYLGSPWLPVVGRGLSWRRQCYLDRLSPRTPLP